MSVVVGANDLQLPPATPVDDDPSRFVSYAQNFEDVMLWRALGHVENGFYVDVGAQDPVLDSVSKAFYDHGWTGIDVEPVPRYAALLRDGRPRNRVLECALSDRAGREPLYVFGETGLSTLLAAQAERNHELLGFSFETREVEVRTLRDVLSEAARDVHWLKIDVEGAEEEVIASWRGATVHPWIVVVEATRPNERLPSHHEWEPILVGAGYSFVYFDGLNRFYVAPEHPELHGAFGAPPNVFDRFKLAAIDRAEHSFRQAERYAKSLEAAAESEREALHEEAQAQRELAGRRAAELTRAAAYAGSLEIELTARGTRLDVLEHELERVAQSARIEMESQRSVAERRRLELDEATVYASTLEAEIAARGTRLEQLDEAIDRVRDLVHATQVELESQRNVVTRRSAELEQASIYAASLEAEIAARGTRLAQLEAELPRLQAAHAEVERYARSLEVEVRRQTDENAALSATLLRDRAESAAALLRAVGEAEDRLARWRGLALEQAAHWRHEIRDLSGHVGLDVGPETAGIESTTDDCESARAVHEATRAHAATVFMEVDRIASGSKRVKQH